MRKRCYATIGVVSRNVVASMDERMSQRQSEVAKEVAEEAARRISVWGSSYSGNEGHVRKVNAIEEVNGALAFVLRKREDWRKSRSVETP